MYDILRFKKYEYKFWSTLSSTNEFLQNVYHCLSVCSTREKTTDLFPPNSQLIQGGAYFFFPINGIVYILKTSPRQQTNRNCYN